MTKGLQTSTLADKVEVKIIDYIKANNLVPGDALPNEMQFVEMLGISRNVVREAFSRLRMLGLIETRTKRGMTIKEPPLLNGFKKVLHPDLMSTKSIKDMMGMRIALEVGITDFIFHNISPAGMRDLEQIVNRQEAIGMNNLSVDDEIQFHTKVYEIAGNDFILQFNQIMHPVFLFAKQNYENYFEPINRKLEQDGEIITHVDLFGFIKDGEKEKYRGAIRQHLTTYWEFLNNF